MKIFSVILFTLLILQFNCYSEIVINEFMALPKSPEPEWIEIYNNSDDVEIINIFKICDDESCKSIENIKLQAFSYNIFTKDTNALKDIYDIGQSAYLFEMSMPGLNNNGDKIIIKINNLSDDLTVDSLFYDKTMVVSGKSTERANYLRPANNKYNLEISNDKSGATPGRANSNLVFKQDLTIESMIVDEDDNLWISIYDLGLEPPDEFAIDLFADMDLNGRKDLNEGFFSEYVDWDGIDYSMKLSYNILELLEGVDYFGEMSIVALVNSPMDGNFDNDKSDLLFSIDPLSGTVLINEILYEPDSLEFIEIYNKSEFNINLQNWQILDSAGIKSGKGSLIDKHVMIEPGHYVVIARDSFLFEKFPELEGEWDVYIPERSIKLNNEEDFLALLSPSGEVIDSLTYFADWHDENLLTEEGISLERVELFNSNQNGLIWTSSADLSGATPLRINSVSQKLSGKYFIEVEPNPASFLDNLFNIQIIYSIPFSNSFLDVIIFDENGNEIIVLADGQYSQDSGVLLWDGTAADGKKVPVGLYICSFSARKSVTNEIYFAKKLIVIANN